MHFCFAWQQTNMPPVYLQHIVAAMAHKQPICYTHNAHSLAQPSCTQSINSIEVCMPTCRWMHIQITYQTSLHNNSSMIGTFLRNFLIFWVSSPWLAHIFPSLPKYRMPIWMRRHHTLGLLLENNQLVGGDSDSALCQTTPLSIIFL